MDEGADAAAADAACSADRWLSVAESLVPAALDKARSTTGFSARWKLIVSRLECVCPCLSDLSGHPCFHRNALCREQLQAVCATLTEAVELADLFRSRDWQQSLGKLHMQSRLDSLVARLDLNLRDCAHLVKSGVLGDVAPPSSVAANVNDAEAGSLRVRELLARLQIGHAQAKHRAAEGLLEAMTEDEKSVLAVLGRTDISALVQLLAPAAAPKTREKAAAVVCALVESGSCESLLLSEGVLPPLIRLAESGGPVGREKAVVSLQRLSMSAETSRSIVGHDGVPPLIEICHIGDSTSQSAAAGTLKNLSSVPEVRQTLAEEGIIGLMINLLDRGIVPGSKEHAAECLQNLTSSNESLRRCAVSEGVIGSLLAYLDGPLPQESAVAALRNLVSSVTTDTLIKLGLLPRLQHVLKDGSPGAQQAAASIICKISSSTEVKRSIGECGCIPLLFDLLGAKAAAATREVAAQGIASLMGCPQNCREAKRDERSVPSLVRLLDPSAPRNATRKHVVSCLLALSSSKRCRKSMVSCGAVGYLKKLPETDVPGVRKLIERLERGKLRSLFSRK